MSGLGSVAASVCKTMEDTRIQEIAKEAHGLVWGGEPETLEEKHRLCCRLTDLLWEASQLDLFGVSAVVSLVSLHRKHVLTEHKSGGPVWFAEITADIKDQARRAKLEGILEEDPRDRTNPAPIRSYVEQVLKPRLAAMEEE